jgi:putative membrane protein
VPLSNFAGWWLVGTVAIAAYAVCCGLGHASEVGRVGAGVALYYAVLGFNLAVTAWIGEWWLLLAGLAAHSVMALILGAMVRRPRPRGVPETRGVQQA